MVKGEGKGQAPCLVSTLGMFIIDQFRFEDEAGCDLGDRGLGSQIGGGGTYFAVGARMWLLPSQILMTVDRGHDFTAQEQAAMDVYAHSRDQSLHNLWHFRDRKEGTTRAINIYRGEERGFAYLTPKLRLDPADLLSNTFPSFPFFIHCICSPSRVSDICHQIDERKEQWYLGSRPIVIWEPIPDSAVPENLEECLLMLNRIDVFSPNHEEIANFLSVSKTQFVGKEARTQFQSLVLTKLFNKIASAKVSQLPIICIRSGALGALIACNARDTFWVDAYHTLDETYKVVDVTGAGNAWLGGFTAGLARHSSAQENDRKQQWSKEQIKEAAQMGSVSASFVVEQQSLPNLSINNEGVELWNGEEATKRLRRLRDCPGI